MDAIDPVAPDPVAPFSHVLCWVDGSGAACRTAEHAAQLAARLGADLTFLAVGTRRGKDEGFEEYARLEGVSNPAPLEMGSQARECLALAIAIAARAGITNAGQIVRQGGAVQALCEVARTSHADLVFVRHPRSSIFDRLFRRSIGQQLTDRCGLTVLSMGYLGAD